VTTNTNTVYPNKEVPDKTNQTNTISATIILPATDFKAFLPAGFPGSSTKLMTDVFRPLDESLGQSQLSGEILTFNAGGAGSQLATPGNFTWTVGQSGTLTTTQGANKVRYDGLDIPLANQDANTDYVFAEVTTPNAKYVDIVKMIRLKAPLVYDAATLKGAYYLYGLGNHETGDAFDGRLNGFSIELNEGRTGFQGSDFIVTENGQEVVRRENVDNTPIGFMRWSLGSDGVLVTQRVFDGTQSTAKARRTCDPASNSNCVVWDERRLIPFSLDGKRRYWLDTRRIAVNSQSAINDSTPTSYIARYFDLDSAVNAISGSWRVRFTNDATQDAEAKLFITFFGDGRYVLGGNPADPECGSWEKGKFVWDPASGQLTVSDVSEDVEDCGLKPQDGSQQQTVLTFRSDGKLAFTCRVPSGVVDEDCDDQNAEGIVLERVSSTANSLIGAWTGTDEPSESIPDPMTVVYFLPNNSFVLVAAETDSSADAECQDGGSVVGRFTFTSGPGALKLDNYTFNTYGECSGAGEGLDGDIDMELTFSNNGTRAQGTFTDDDAEGVDAGDTFNIEKITTP
jgi:hypothetical protein